jgi:hypothetical protein
MNDPYVRSSWYCNGKMGATIVLLSRPPQVTNVLSKGEATHAIGHLLSDFKNSPEKTGSHTHPELIRIAALSFFCSSMGMAGKGGRRKNQKLLMTKVIGRCLGFLPGSSLR